MKQRIRAEQGITLIELAISMAIFGILSVAVASLLTSGINTQMSYRAHEYQHTIAIDVVDALRSDLLTAGSVDVTGGGTGLTIRNSAGGTIATWATGGTFNAGCSGGPVSAVLRNGQPIGISPAPCRVPMTISCGGNGAPGCFQGFDAAGNAATTNVRRVVLHELTVVHNSNGTSSIDREFGPATYRLNEFSFEVIAGSTFQ